MSLLVLTENGKLVKKNLTLAQAAVAADLAGKTVVVNTPQTLAASLAWPADRTLKFEEGGYVNYHATYRLTGLPEARPEWFGAVGNGEIDDVNAIKLAAAASRRVILRGDTTYASSDLLLIDGHAEAQWGLWISGEGRNSKIDFKLATGAVAFMISHNVTVGGQKYIKMSDFSIGDSRSTSAATTLLMIDGGPVGAIDPDPSEAIAYIQIDHLYLFKFNQPTDGRGVHLRNLSSIDFNFVNYPYQANLKYGLVIDNDTIINTGVMSITNNNVYAAGTPLLIEAKSNLLDTFSITGNGFFQHENALSDQPAIYFKMAESTGISALVFEGNHIERRPYTANTGTVIAVEGVTGTGVGAFYCNSISRNHFYCTDAKRALYGIQFIDASVYSCTMVDNEWGYLVAQSSGGYVFRYEDTCYGSAGSKTLASVSPSRINAGTRLGATPGLISVGNEDTTSAEENAVWANIMQYGDIGRRIVIADGAFVSFIPPQVQGVIDVTFSTNVTFSGMVRYETDGSPYAANIYAGANFASTTGALTGAATEGKLTFSSGTDGKLYIENQSTVTANVIVSYLSLIRPSTL